MNTFPSEEKTMQTSSEIHRRPLLNCGFPAFVIYRAWWVESSNNSQERKTDTENDDNDVFSNILDKFVKDKDLLINEYQAMVNKFDKITEDSSNIFTFPEHLFSDIKYTSISHTAYRSSVKWRGAGVKFLVDLHDDYISLTIIIDMSKSFNYLKSTLKPADNHDANFSPIKRVLRLVDSLKEYNKEKNHNESTEDNIEKIDDLRSDLLAKSNGVYNELPKIIDHDIFNILGTTSFISGKKLKEFADFRCLLLSSDISYDYNNIKEPVPPFKNDEVEFANNEERNIVSDYWAFIKTLDYGISKREVIACTVMNNGAIYSSTLGGQYGEEEDKLVKYTILSKNNNRWQLGRLISVVNNLGMARLQAIRDLKLLKTVSSEVQIMGSYVDEQQKRNAEGSFDESSFKVLKEKYSKASNINGYVDFRINRSKYFVKFFKSNLIHLRSKRIEGFQPYEEFISSMLYQTFEFIDKLGDRITKLRNRVSLLIQSLQITQAQELLKEQNKFARIGETVEIIAVTYYGGVILGKSINYFGDNNYKSGGELIGFLFAFILWTILQYPIKYAILYIRNYIENKMIDIVTQIKNRND